MRRMASTLTIVWVGIALTLVAGCTGSAKNPTMGVVPNVVGLTQESAKQTMMRAGFSEGEIATRAADASSDIVVLGQTPAPGAKAPSGAKVDLVVAAPAEEMIEVPELAGGKKA